LEADLYLPVLRVQSGEGVAIGDPHHSKVVDAGALGEGNGDESDAMVPLFSGRYRW